MIGGCHGLQVHSHTNNFIVFTGLFCKASGPHIIENRYKRLYNPSTQNQNMNKKPLNISEEAAVQMPMKTVA